MRPFSRPILPRLKCEKSLCQDVLAGVRADSFPAWFFHGGGGLGWMVVAHAVLELDVEGRR